MHVKQYCTNSFLIVQSAFVIFLETHCTCQTLYTSIRVIITSRTPPSSMPVALSRVAFVTAVALAKPRCPRAFVSLRRTSFLSYHDSRLSTMPRHISSTSTSVPTPVPASSPVPPVASATTTVQEPRVKFLKDYAPPSYLISNTCLEFRLDDAGLNTTVAAALDIRRACPPGTPLVLDGEGLELVSSPCVNGVVLSDSQYVYDRNAHTLTVQPSALPDGSFSFESEVRICPAKNMALDGLYMSAGDYCTQCEAEGFRRITFYLDRPDVMAKFSVRIEASKAKCPILLSNGNCVKRGDAENGRHWAEFQDPFPKPCYLFALVAGDLNFLQDKFVTMGGKSVDLKVFVKGQSEVAKCHHAMRSLKKAMKWDEDVYGLEYNYDVFSIVAVPTFVFGAMENTSLNIFNSKYVLVSPETATDSDFNAVEGVVAHEYFHNYSGNRVTVNSWFQLSLKEGLTVFRDQSFSADMNSAAVKRIRDVSSLRSYQFAEDAGPMAHPIRPTSYITCNSFYTATVYNKGAEVIRMLRTLVGPTGFRRGTDIYFSRHDGQAVTCDDWVQAIQDANPDVDLSVFRRWYNQSGTPIVVVDVKYDEEKSALMLTCEQSIPATSKQPTTEPVLIPLRMGLIGPDGSVVPVDMGDGTPAVQSKVLNFGTTCETFVLHNVPKGTIPSLLRGFSAPVKLQRKEVVSPDELSFIMANDTDEFNRWESGQKLALDYIVDSVNSEGEFAEVSKTVVSAFRKTLTNNNVNASLRAELFALPSESYIVEQMAVADPVRIRAARKHLQKQLAENLESEFKLILNTGLSKNGEYKLDPVSQGDRALKNVALGYLASLQKKENYALCLDIVRNGSNMTDVLAALSVLSSSKAVERETGLGEFYEKWKSDYLVVDKWLRIQSTASSEDVLDIVKELTLHAAYKETVPNSVYALIGGYASSNMHIPSDGSGYQFIGDQVIGLERINPQVAARISRCFTRWRKFDASRQAQMEVELRRIKSVEGLSKDVYEVVKNCLVEAS